MPNPDGTVQVAPPQISAFSPQASGGAPPPSAAPPVQTSSAPQPGFADAIMALIHALAGNVNPSRHLTQRPGVVDSTVDDAAGLGQHFDAGR
jgi:hypothetical protein